MKILAFAASNSTQSINRQLLNYATTLIEGAEVEMLDINDYEMPLYSSDREAAHGIPDEAHPLLRENWLSPGVANQFCGTQRLLYSGVQEPLRLDLAHRRQGLPEQTNGHVVDITRTRRGSKRAQHGYNVSPILWRGTEGNDVCTQLFRQLRHCERTPQR